MSQRRELAPGEVRLYSYHAPSLTGGLHTVEVSKTVKVPKDQPITGKEREKDIPQQSQSFNVLGPRFSLPPDSVDSVFPAPGDSAEHTILPHIVLRDPHLPWSRPPSHIPDGEDANDIRRRSTWLALLSFPVDELLLPSEQIQSILQDVPLSDDKAQRKQTDTCSLRMRARDTVLLKHVINATGFSPTCDARDAAESTDVVLLRRDLFAALFSDPGTIPSTGLNVAGFKYFAHVRKVATDGMAEAGANADEAMFSVVVSRRTGPIDSDVPTAMAVHLLSLDWDTEVVRSPLPGDDDEDTRVAVTSLYSWTYTCLPSKNVASPLDRLTFLGDKLAVLRTGGDASSSSTDPATRISQRQTDGYTLTRYRTVTGEETAAIIRGPLSPTVPRPLRPGFSMQSNFGSDLAIFDADLGLLDITYASAWQLGKTLAMGDSAFCAALGRLRRATRALALDKAKRDVHIALDERGHAGAMVGARRDTAVRMLDLVQGLNALNHSTGEHGFTAVGANRWSTRAEDEQQQETLDNEYGVPESPDYALVYSWVVDKLHLGNVPANYLIPDPAFLPDESLRLFHIDANWTDALVDGALSLANHWGSAPDRDDERTAIKKSINARLHTPDAKLGGWHIQMPRYGFLLRSQLLVQFPDLAVSVQFAPERRKPVIPAELNTAALPLPYGVPPQQPILVQKRLAPDTMYCLFDAAPPDLQNITFTMPAHQQCFTIGQTLTADHLIVSFKKVYTTDTRPEVSVGINRDNNLGESVTFSNDGKPGAVFNWKHRTINSARFAEFQRKKLVEEMGQGEFTDTVPTAAVLGLQLNDPILQLDIGKLDTAAPTSSESNLSSSEPFQLSTLDRAQSGESSGLVGQVVFELVPRTRPGMPFALLDDASFRLPRAQIAQYEGLTRRYAYVRVLYEVDRVLPRESFADGASVAIGVV